MKINMTNNKLQGEGGNVIIRVATLYYLKCPVIKNMTHEKQQEIMVHIQVRKQSMEFVPEIAHIQDLLDKEFKSVTVIIKKMTKENL